MSHFHFFLSKFFGKKNASHSFFSCPGFLGQLGGTLSKNNSPLCFCPGFLVSKKCLTFILFWCRIFGFQKKSAPSFFLVQDFWRDLGGTLSKKSTPFFVQDFCPGFLVSKKMLHLHFLFFLSKIFGKKNASRSFFFLSRIFGKPKNASPSCFLVQGFW